MNSGAVMLHNNSTRTEMATTSLISQEIDAVYARMKEAQDTVDELLKEVSESPELTTAKAVLAERSYTFELLKRIRDASSA